MNRPETGLSAALRRLPAPEPGSDLLPRILRSRAMGVRIADQPNGPAIPWRWLAAAAVVGVSIGGSWFVSLSLSRLGSSPQVRDPLDNLLRGVWRPEREPSESGKTPLPKYALITSDDLDVTRLTEGVWTYTVETTTDDVLTEKGGAIGIRLARAHHLGQPVLMVNSKRQLRGGPWGQYGDTAHLDPATLRPLRSVAYANKFRTQFSQTFSADSGRESIVITGPMPRSWRGSVALPFPRNALFLNDWSTTRLAVLLPAVALERHWHGSLYQVSSMTQNVDRSIAPLDLRVVGTDNVTVPAGTFDCWRLEVETHLWNTERETLWVSRDKGWVIKKQIRGPDFVVSTLLHDFEPER